MRRVARVALQCRSRSSLSGTRQHPAMTDDRMALIELIEKGADSDLVRELLAFAADRMMELEV
jgi:hypothetical protein